MTLAIRTAGPPTLAIPALRRALGESAPGVGLESADSFETLLGGPLALPRLNALLLAIFASAALLIAAVGLHGVVSAMVRQRTRELGIRLALGATGATLHALVMREVFAVVSVGAAAGLAGSLVLSHALHALVFEASPTDPTILGGILGVLLLAAMAGALAPARRAARTDPARVLRME
jgi:ABC-type antimicrobial peptide transport system permease subunit